MGVGVRLGGRSGRVKVSGERTTNAFSALLSLRMPANLPNPADAVAATQAIYADLAQRPIERGCTRLTECCQFRLTGRTPFLTKGEALTAAKGLRATGRTKLPERTDGACPLLGPEGRCMIYDARPFGCRTHFCAAAGGPYARREVVDLIHRLEDIDQKFGGEGALPIGSAVARVLKEGRR
jgi:Fe-S-cluster containining protein